MTQTENISKPGDNNGLVVGLVITLLSYLLALTLVAPMIAISPGSLIEYLLKNIRPLLEPKEIRIFTVIILVFLLAVLIWVTVRLCRVYSKRGYNLEKLLVFILLIPFYFLANAIGC